MGREQDEIDALRGRVDALEQLCVELQGRIAALEAAPAAAPDAAFHMADEEPTV